MTPPPQKAMIVTPPAREVVPPSEFRPAAPVIRPRAPAPMMEPEIELENEDIFVAEPMPIPPAPQPEQPKERSFASLFGWKSKPADEQAAPQAQRVAEDDNFDDDLEIPAFLRRSGNA